MLVGDVTVRMAADIADLRTGFEQARALGEKFGNDLTSALSSAKGALAALGVTLSVGLFAHAIKEAIDYADKLNDLAQRTGLTVETLGGLEYAAKQNGTSMETLTKGVQKLNVLMAEAKGGNKEAAATFEALGVTVGTTDQALFDIADKMAGYKSGAEKAALAQAAFGKAGAELIPLLNQGSAALREQIAEYMKWGGVSDDTAKRADAFNDTLEKIKLMSGAFMRTLTAELLPVLNVLAGLFVEMKEKGGDFGGAVGFVVSAVKVVGVTVVGAVAAFQVLGQAIGAVAAAMVQFAQGNYKEAWNTLKAGAVDAVDTIKKAIEDGSKIWNASTATMIDMGKKLPQASAPVVKAAKDAKDAIAEYEAQMYELGQAIEKAQLAQVGIEQETTNYDKALKKVLEDQLAGKIVVWAEAEAYLALARSLDEAQKKTKLYNQEEKEAAEYASKVVQERKAYEEQQKRIYDQTSDLIVQMDIENDALAREIGIIGQDATARIALNAQLEREKVLRQNLDAEQEANLLKLIDEREQLLLQKTAIEQNVSAWRSLVTALEDGVRGFIADWVNGGLSNAFRNLWANFKAWALQALAEIAAKTVVVNLVGAVGAGASGGASAGGLGGLGNLLNLGGGTSGILGSLFGSSFSAAAGAGMSAGFETLGIALSAGAEAVGGFASVAGAAMASVVPVVGAVVAAGMLLYSWLGSKGGGLKSGGFAASGATPGIFGTDSDGRWFTPKSADAELTKSVQGLQSQYDALIKALGGTGGAAFAIGYDSDPKGTAPNRLHAGAWVNGRQVFNSALGDLGKDDATLQAALSLESKRALLAAIQNSDLPADIAHIVNSISAVTASSADIDRVLELAAAFTDLRKVMSANPLDDVLKAMADAADGTYGAVKRAGDALQEQIDDYDGSLEATKNLTAATRAYYQAQVQLIAQIQQVKQAVSAMFTDTIRSLTYQTLSDNPGDANSKYRFLMAEADRLRDQIGTETDPAKIRDLANRINADIQAAFGLLSPDEQRTMLATFVQRTNEINQLVDGRLNALQMQVQNDAAAILATLDTKLTAAANNMNAAADALKTAAGTAGAAADKTASAADVMAGAATDQRTAADAQLQAAQTPIVVQVVQTSSLVNA